MGEKSGSISDSPYLPSTSSVNNNRSEFSESDLGGGWVVGGMSRGGGCEEALPLSAGREEGEEEGEAQKSSPHHAGQRDGGHGGKHCWSDPK